jgi:hypothetical protein
VSFLKVKETHYIAVRVFPIEVNVLDSLIIQNIRGEDFDFTLIPFQLFYLAFQRRSAKVMIWVQQDTLTDSLQAGK